MLSPERDEQLSQMTKHRVNTFAHDLVPDYLRTKLEPLAETKMMQLEHKAATLTLENAQVNYYSLKYCVSINFEIYRKYLIYTNHFKIMEN